MSFVDALCTSSGFNCNHFSNIIDCKDGRILYSADIVLVINLFVTKNKFMETNFTTIVKTQKYHAKGNSKQFL